MPPATPSTPANGGLTPDSTGTKSLSGQPRTDPDSGSGDTTLNESELHPSHASTESSETVSLNKLVAELVTRDQSKKFKLRQELGRGGMGVVLDAQDVNLHRAVAMKVILDPRTASRQRVLQFIEEAQITAQLQHPGVMPIYELGVDESGNVYYTMKRVTGKTLKEILKGIKEKQKDLLARYSTSRLLNILQRVGDAIAYAHSKGVVHRDLKPDNIIVGDYGEVLVLDWGLAKILKRKDGIQPSGLQPATNRPADPRATSGIIQSVRSDNAECDSLLTTMDGNVMGTPGYMSPEQASGMPETIDERTDIYSLGAILYQILTQRAPVKWGEAGQKAEVLKVLEQIREGRIERPKASAQAPEALIAVAMKALATKPPQRYQSVKEFQRDLEAYQGGFVTSAENWSIWKLIRLFVLRHKTTSGAALIILGLLLAGLSINIVERIRAERAEKSAVQQMQRAEQALADLRATAPALLALSDSFVERKEMAKALQIASQAVDLVPSNVEAHLRRGQLLQTLNRFTEAAEEFQTVLKLDPQQEIAQRNLELSRGMLATVDTQKLFLALRAQDRLPEAVHVISPLRSQPAVLKQFLQQILTQENIKYRQLAVDMTSCTMELPDGKPATLRAIRGFPLSHLALYNEKNPVDLSPLKGMSLSSLNVSGSSGLSDLSPLKGMPLTFLHLKDTDISDLSPLKGMPLKWLSLWGCIRVSDLSPLKGMPLTFISFSYTPITDLSPLQGMPLAEIFTFSTKARDLSPLKGLPLTTLDFSGSDSISNLTPLKELPLTALRLQGCRNVTDLSPLKGLRLQILTFDYSHAVTGLDAIREMKTLTTINSLPAAEFWKNVVDK